MINSKSYPELTLAYNNKKDYLIANKKQDILNQFDYYHNFELNYLDQIDDFIIENNPNQYQNILRQKNNLDILFNNFKDNNKWLIDHSLPEPIFDLSIKEQEELDNEFLTNKKRIRDELVKNIKVTTTNGNVFDGDEISQSRMSRVILLLDQQLINWKLADNTIKQIDKLELQEALALSLAEQSNLWFN